jgi:hypothetical protein
MFFFLRFAPEQDAMGIGDLDSFLIEPVLNSFPEFSTHLPLLERSCLHRHADHKLGLPEPFHSKDLDGFQEGFLKPLIALHLFSDPGENVNDPIEILSVGNPNIQN